MTSTRILILLTAIAAVAVAAIQIRAQAPSLNETVGIADSGWTVTFSRGTEPLGSFDVPKGVYLAMRFNDQQPHTFDFDRKRLEFHGDIELHAHTSSESYDHRFHPESPELEQEATGGLVFSATGVDLVLERSHQ